MLEVAQDHISPPGAVFGRFPPAKQRRFGAWNLLHALWRVEIALAGEAGRKPHANWSKVSRAWFSFMFEAVSWESPPEEMKARALEWHLQELSFQG
jgi:hypothetical protein